MRLVLYEKYTQENHIWISWNSVLLVIVKKYLKIWQFERLCSSELKNGKKCQGPLKKLNYYKFPVFSLPLPPMEATLMRLTKSRQTTRYNKNYIIVQKPNHVGNLWVTLISHVDKHIYTSGQ